MGLSSDDMPLAVTLRKGDPGIEIRWGIEPAEIKAA
jgi:hypothetical protein